MRTGTSYVSQTDSVMIPSVTELQEKKVIPDVTAHTNGNKGPETYPSDDHV